MLSDILLPLTNFDRQLFSALVPRDHRLRRALELIPWDDFEKNLAIYYCPDAGRPAAAPVLMLKLEFLRYQFGFRSAGDQADRDGRGVPLLLAD